MQAKTPTPPAKKRTAHRLLFVGITLEKAGDAAQIEAAAFAQAAKKRNNLLENRDDFGQIGQPFVQNFHYARSGICYPNQNIYDAVECVHLLICPFQIIESNCIIAHPNTKCKHYFDDFFAISNQIIYVCKVAKTTLF
jgi:hypothetical protein